MDGKVITITTSDLLSVQETARILKRPRLTIYRWIEGGKIIGIKLGGILFIPTSEVERLLQKQKDPSVRSPLPAQGV